ncbi:actin, flagellar inner arm intermediate chain [Pelomyxa schiedti]|nr:actin, flagellar inner arm intermediate chain [Pelomyxa schiedti]
MMRPVLFRAPSWGERQGHYARVELACSFDNWERRVMRHRWFTDPTPSLQLSLPPGKHQYMFFLDGNPRCDSSRQLVNSWNGEYRNVVDVPDDGGVDPVICGQLADTRGNPVTDWMEAWADESHLPAVVADIGAARSRMGYSCDVVPPFDFLSIKSQPHHQGCSSEQREYWGKNVGIANFLVDYDGVMNTEYVLEMVKHGVKFLGAENSPIIFAEPSTPELEKSEREGLVQQILDSDIIPAAVLMVPSELLALYSTGRTSGLVVDCGEHYTRVTPISEGQVLKTSCRSIHLGGRNISRHLGKNLSSTGQSFSTESIDYIKHNLTYVAQNFETEVQKRTTTYSLPDGQTVDLGPDLIRTPEPMFTPSLIERDGLWSPPQECVPGSCHSSILSCIPDLQEVMSQNIVLAGGNSMFPGFAKRLTREMTKLGTNVKITARPNRAFSTWIGGCAVASLSTFAQRCFTSAFASRFINQLVYPVTEQNPNE